MGTLVCSAELQQRSNYQDPVTMVQSYMSICLVLAVFFMVNAEAGIPSDDRQANQLVNYCKTNAARFDCSDLASKLGTPLTVAKVKAWWKQQLTSKESNKVKAFCTIHPSHPTCQQTAQAAPM